MTAQAVVTMSTLKKMAEYESKAQRTRSKLQEYEIVKTK